MTEAELKNAIDKSFSEMQRMTNRISELLKKMGGANATREMINEVVTLQRQWSELARKYVADSRNHHNLFVARKTVTYPLPWETLDLPSEYFEKN